MNKKIILFISSFILLNSCSNETNISFNGINNNGNIEALAKSKDTVLVKFKNDINSLSLNSFTSKNNTKVIKVIKKIGVYELEIPKATNSISFMKELNKDNNIKYIEPNYKVFADNIKVETNDPYFNQQYSLAKVEAQKAWEINNGSKDIKIAIVDTGIDLEHPDLKDKIIKGYNALNPQEPPKDDARHGTHVAGIAAAMVNNGLGVAGLAAKCSIMPVKVLSSNGGTLSSIADGLIWAVDNGADIVNMSLGTYSENETLAEAVKYALNKGVTCIATMGNDNTEKIRFPAGYPGMIAVGSTDNKDNRSSFSNYGNWITVSAPGSSIMSTLPTYMSTNGYGVLSGTSMAAPLVTGLVGLIKSQKRGISTQNVIRILKDSSDDLGEKGFDKYFGAGRINAYRALNSSLLK